MQMNAYSLFICFGQPLYCVHTTDDVNWRATFHATAKTWQTLLGISDTLSPADRYQILPSTRPGWRWCLSRAISSLYPRATQRHVLWLTSVPTASTDCRSVMQNHKWNANYNDVSLASVIIAFRGRLEAFSSDFDPSASKMAAKTISDSGFDHKFRLCAPNLHIWNAFLDVYLQE